MNAICPCFSCGKQISYMWSQHVDSNLMMVEDAVEIDVYGSYGSRFDLSHIRIWICDDCLEQKSDWTVVIAEDVNELNALFGDELFDGDDQ